MKGHRNSKGELAEWVIKSHETGKILSSHKSEQKAKEHLQQMHIFQEAADGGQAEDFHTLINRYATATASIINKFLEKYELSIEVVDTEEGKDFFEETGAIAVRLASLQDDVHVAPVAINEELISRYYYDEWDEDNTILNECVSDTLWHEACHHICLYISDTLDVDIMDNDSEEDIVENYALYMTSKTMGIHKEFSADLVDKFSGAFAILDAMNNGAFDKESLKEMMKFLYPSVDSENDLGEILEDIGLTESDSKSPVCAHCGWDGDGNLTEYNGRLLCPNCLKEFQRLDANRDANGYIKYHNITKRSDGFNPEGYKLLGESTYGTDMDKRIKIFMEGVNQLGLSSRQVEAIGKLTNACMESALDDSTDEGLVDSELLVYTPENDAEFFKEAFKRAAIKVQDKFPDRLYEDEVPEKGLVLVDKKSGNRFSLVLRKGPADPIHFDPNCHGIEVRIGSDRKEYPLWLRKSKSIDELIDLMFDCIAQEVRYASDDDELTYNHTGRGKKVHMEGVVGNGDISRDDEAYGLLLQRLHDIDVPDETIEIATHILGDSKETLIKIGNAVATMINNDERRGFRDADCFVYDHKTGKVKFCMEGVGRRPVFYMEDRATATNPDPNYRIMYRELVEKGFSRDTLGILTTILGATVDTLKKISQAKHELEERDNMSLPAEAFRDWNGKHDNSDNNEELGSMDFGGDVGPDSAFWDLPIGGFDDYFGGDGDSGEIGKISER